MKWLNPKKGQVTVFIIIAIVILALLFLLSHFRSGVTESKVEQDMADTASGKTVKNYIDSCLKETAKEALEFIGSHGGYYELPELHDEKLSLPYYFNENQNTMISRIEMENQIKSYLDNELFFCIRRFSGFQQQGYEIIVSDFETSAKLGNENLEISLNSPVIVKKDETTKTLTGFSATVETRIGTMHNIISEFMTGQAETPGSICISCLVDFAIDNDLRVEMVPLGETEKEGGRWNEEEESNEDNQAENKQANREKILFIVYDEKKKTPKTFEFINNYIFEAMNDQREFDEAE